MTNKEKLIKLYNESLKTGELPSNGLCCSLKELKIKRNKLYLFEPNFWDEQIIVKEGKSWIYWASDVKKDELFNYYTKFTPLRQTILAFLIAMEN